MKTKHTPGPWIVDNKWEALTIKNIREMPMKNGTIEETILEIAQGFIPNSKNLALIVTAPEMLEALMKIYTKLCSEQFQYLQNDFENELINIEKAIQKARGD